MKNKMKLLFTGFLINYAHYVEADIALCKEKDGYIKRDSLMSINGPDCTDNEQSGLCSIAVSVPKIVEGREFRLFTFFRKTDNQIKTYLNIAPTYQDGMPRIGLEFEEKSAKEIMITVVYENLKGCSLKSHLNLGELSMGQGSRKSTGRGGPAG